MVVGAAFGSICALVFQSFRISKKSVLESSNSIVNDQTHCSECICSNPFLTEMPFQRAGQRNEELRTNLLKENKSLGEITTSSTTCSNDLTSFDEPYRNPDNEFSLLVGNTYDREFINKCKDPDFLKEQLKIIEEEYKVKIKKLEYIRVNEITNKKAQYDAIRAEILDEN